MNLIETESYVNMVSNTGIKIKKVLLLKDNGLPIISRVYDEKKIYPDLEDTSLAISSIVSALLHFTEQYLANTLNDFGIGAGGLERHYIRKTNSLVCVVTLEAPINQIIDQELGNEVVDVITLQIFKNLTEMNLVEELAKYDKNIPQFKIQEFILKLDTLITDNILRFNK